MSKLPDIKKAFEEAFQCDLNVPNLSPDYQESASFTVQEIRDIVKVLTHADSLLSMIGYRGLLSDGISDRETVLKECKEVSGQLRSLYESR